MRTNEETGENGAGEKWYGGNLITKIADFGETMAD